MMQNHIHPALEWRNGQPYSSYYDDVYFSTNPENPQQGLEETNYVFLKSNDLASRFNHLIEKSFTIVETGFGTGLNFLCVCQLWLEKAPKNAHLYFISIEKHPLTIKDMQQAHQLWPTLHIESKAFLAQYVSLAEGTHQFHLFDQKVSLILWIGDVSSVLPQINTKIDAWFLDGFSPAKNPQMWQPSLYAQMARLSYENTTFATFTSAGFVKRGLESAGFSVQKQAGYGKKREMLKGTFKKTRL